MRSGLKRCAFITAWVSGLLAWPGWASAAGRETTGSRTWWLPENVFPASETIDTLFYFILYMTGGVCIAVFAVLGYFLVRYRHKPGRRAKFIHGNSRLEAVWTLIPTVIMALTAAVSQATWSNLKFHPEVEEGETVVRMAVIGRQFQWYYHYPGADGKLGPRRTGLVNPDSSEPDAHVGLDRSHPDAKDDLLTSKMYIPVGTRVFIDLTSVDVLHSFFLPNFRLKQDAVPGLTGKVWLQASKTSAQVIGTEADGSPKPFDIVCAELCGQGHYKMRGQMFVVGQDAYEKFLADEAEYLDFGDDDEEGYY